MLCVGVQLWGRGRGSGVGEPSGLGYRACLQDLHQSSHDGLTSRPTVSWTSRPLSASGAPGLAQDEGVRQVRCVAVEGLPVRTFVSRYHNRDTCPKDGDSEVLFCTFLFKEKKKVSISLCTQVLISQLSLSLKTEPGAWMSMGSQRGQRAKVSSLRRLSHVGLSGRWDAGPHLHSPPTQMPVSSDTPTDTPGKHVYLSRHPLLRQADSPPRQERTCPSPPPFQASEQGGCRTTPLSPLIPGWLVMTRLHPEGLQTL